MSSPSRPRSPRTLGDTWASRKALSKALSERSAALALRPGDYTEPGPYVAENRDRASEMEGIARALSKRWLNNPTWYAYFRGWEAASHIVFWAGVSGADGAELSKASLMGLMMRRFSESEIGPWKAGGKTRLEKALAAVAATFAPNLISIGSRRPR